jgi:hypothetical protein
LLAFVGGFDLLNAFLYLFFEDFSHELASFDVQEVIEVVDITTVGGVIADVGAVVEQSIETLVKESPNCGTRGWGTHKYLRVRGKLTNPLKRTF